MNVNVNKNMYWVFRPFTWLSLFVGIGLVIGFCVFVSAMLEVKKTADAQPVYYHQIGK